MELLLKQVCGVVDDVESMFPEICFLEMTSEDSFSYFLFILDLSIYLSLL